MPNSIPSNPRLESVIQSSLIKKYESQGYMVVKLILTNKSGIPDLLLLKDGKASFVEVKRHRQKPRPLQEYRINELRSLGFEVHSDLCTLFQQRSLTSCLAVDSGFAYYSLSSIFITEYRGAELGTIALLANIVREMITLLLAPMLAKRFGPLAPITAGGATTMDTTLPIIAQASGQKYVALSIYHGFVTDFSVPFLVTMWCTIGA